MIEQAKGLLAQHGQFDMTDAFAVLRRYPRDHNLRLTDVARDLISWSLPVQQLIDHATSRNACQAR